MLMEEIKADLNEAAEEKLKALIADTVEKKVRKEVRKITKKLTIRFVLTGAALAGACLFIDRSGKIVDIVKKEKADA